MAPFVVKLTKRIPMTTAASISIKPSDNVKGVLLALVSTGLFAIVAAMAKIAVTEFHVLQILLFRQLVVLASCLPQLQQDFPRVLTTQHPKLHAARLMGAFTALSCGIWAVAVLPLTTAITLGFAQVFFVTLLALLVLKETVSRHRIIAVIFGFIGVVVVMRPGINGLFNAYALIPLLGAAGAAVAVISVRKLSQTEKTATLLIYQAVFVGLLAAIPLIWFWQTPDLKEALFLLLMGVIATAGQWIGVKSLRVGEASVIGNIQYVGLIYATILGFVFFREVPDVFTLIGATFIVGSSLYMLHIERKTTTNRHAA